MATRDRGLFFLKLQPEDKGVADGGKDAEYQRIKQAVEGGEGGCFGLLVVHDRQWLLSDNVVPGGCGRIVQRPMLLY